MLFAPSHLISFSIVKKKSHLLRMTTAADCTVTAFQMIYEVHDSVLKAHMTVGYQSMKLISWKDSESGKMNFTLNYSKQQKSAMWHKQIKL